MQEVGRAGRLHLLGERDCLGGVVGARARDDGHSPVHLVHGDLDHAPMLGGGHRHRFTGGATGHHEMNALGVLPIHKLAQCRFVDRAVSREWRHEGSPTSFQSFGHWFLAAIREARPAC